ncbi:MAG: HAD family hydrolase [Gammaproteobacteria bacterium]|nr:HAD family hydrolase [Gammaproteobacteria bacterium]
MPRIRVITFDLDNTLWDVRTVIGNAEHRMRAWLAEHVPEVIELYEDGAVIQQIRDELISEQPAVVHDLSTLREEVVFRAVRRCGRNENAARQLAQGAFCEFFEARHEVEYFDGALEALAALSKRYTLGSLTNGNADAKKLRLDRFFSFNFTAAGVGIGKPAPDMFQAALRHNGVSADAAVHIGDHPVDDIQAAQNVGMHTVWTNGPVQRSMRRSEVVIEPTVEIEELAELTGAIEQIEAL